MIPAKVFVLTPEVPKGKADKLAADLAAVETPPADPADPPLIVDVIDGIDGVEDPAGLNPLGKDAVGTAIPAVALVPVEPIFVRIRDVVSNLD
jgi:hypothetical protein